MIQLCYISTARPTVDGAQVDDILAQSRRNNRAARITGLLLFNGKRFLQLLEGSAPAVEETYARVLRDPRHFAIVKLSERTIEAREFGDWDMSFRQVPGDIGREAMLAQVNEFTSIASPNVKALFTSYVEV